MKSPDISLHHINHKNMKDYIMGVTEFWIHAILNKIITSYNQNKYGRYRILSL